MDFYIFYTVVNRRKRFTHTLQKCPPHCGEGVNVLTLPSENENITIHTFIMHSLNITHCIKLNGKCACVLVFVLVATILNILCDVNLFSLYLMNFMF